METSGAPFVRLDVIASAGTAECWRNAQTIDPNQLDWFAILSVDPLEEGNETVRVAVDADEYARACSIGGPELAASAIYQFIECECSLVDGSWDSPNLYDGLDQGDKNIPGDDEIPF